MARSAFVTVSCLVLSLAAKDAASQEDFSRIRAKPGQRIVVTEGGLAVEGPLLSLAPDLLVVGDHEIRPAPGLRIERDNGNTATRGMRRGAGIGAALGLATSGGNAAAALLGGFSGGFWGTLIGAGNERRTLLYLSTASPLVAPQLALPEPPLTQTSPPAIAATFTDLRIKLGDEIFVTDNGVVAHGFVTASTPGRITIGDRDFVPKTELKIERAGDPIWDGATYGFLIGSLVGVTWGAEACLNRPMWHCAVESGAVWAGIGSLIDLGHKGRTTVYDTTRSALARTASHVTPVLGRGVRGVAVALEF